MGNSLIGIKARENDDGFFFFYGLTHSPPLTMSADIVGAGELLQICLCERISVVVKGHCSLLFLSPSSLSLFAVGMTALRSMCFAAFCFSFPCSKPASGLCLGSCLLPFSFTGLMQLAQGMLLDGACAPHHTTETQDNNFQINPTPFLSIRPTKR